MFAELEHLAAAARAIALPATSGLSRGVAARSSGKPVTAPVGEATFGRLFDAFGAIRDSGSALPADTPRRLIHHPPPRDKSSSLTAFRQLAPSRESVSPQRRHESPRVYIVFGEITVRAHLLLSALFLGSVSQAFALEGGFPMGGRQSRAEQVAYCAQSKSDCLQNVGPFTRYPSQRAQCVIRYDQCLNR
ncbi:hypothetical protein GJ654_08470 [Rhodoblastus acidophilus]|uniref:Uncharacterized protein n=1 Tax=Rhodoblastus acidophilus TaxID=1074 RepID=A0A6N8DKV8_RHOAC|nr:hypothetical protein [Rhodoblastus acidophilus]MCW2273824.1 hypothetical protein [Rhodoblastus acidophilus]MTV31027.1 hypothetical protein [Rhodoblastus acidophilus]